MCACMCVCACTCVCYAADAQMDLLHVSIYLLYTLSRRRQSQYGHLPNCGGLLHLWKSLPSHRKKSGTHLNVTSFIQDGEGGRGDSRALIVQLGDQQLHSPAAEARRAGSQQHTQHLGAVQTTALHTQHRHKPCSFYYFSSESAAAHIFRAKPGLN